VSTKNRRLAIVEDWDSEYAQGVNDIEDVRCDRCKHWAKPGASAGKDTRGWCDPLEMPVEPEWGCASFEAKEGM
jgi:hypothetical protein